MTVRGPLPVSGTRKIWKAWAIKSRRRLKVDDIYQAVKISRQLEQAAGKGFMATNWMEQNKGSSVPSGWSGWSLSS